MLNWKMKKFLISSTAAKIQFLTLLVFIASNTVAIALYLNYQPQLAWGVNWISIVTGLITFPIMLARLYYANSWRWKLEARVLSVPEVEAIAFAYGIIARMNQLYPNWKDVMAVYPQPGTDYHLVKAALPHLNAILRTSGLRARLLGQPSWCHYAIAPDPAIKPTQR